MQSALRVRAFVCLDCRLHRSQNFRRRYQSNVAEAQQSPPPIDLSTGLPFDASKSIKKLQAASQPQPKPKPNVRTPNQVRSPHETALVTEGAQVSIQPSKQDVALNEENEEGALSLPEKLCIKTISQLRKRLEAGIALGEPSKSAVPGVLFETAVKAARQAGTLGHLDQDALNLFQNKFTGQHASKFMDDTDLVQHKSTFLRRKLLHSLGIGKQQLEGFSKNLRNTLSRQRKHRLVTRTLKTVPRLSRVLDMKSSPMAGNKSSAKAHDTRELAASSSVPVGAEDSGFEKSSQGSKDAKRSVPMLDSTKIQLLRENDVKMEPLALDSPPTVPSLSFDLSRVLFNPGVYQLQDPRSRVFNFSPYLQRILPVSEFNFDALNEYITSSRDSSLRELGLKHQKKYLGSSSSMTGILTHFHFLLSAWRPITVRTLSQSFTDPLRSFTQYQRGPSAIFLRWQDGIYAVDADKEYDSANILMSLGKSMEKLLTLEEEDFERYRKSAQEQGIAPPRPQPEVYHYTESGDFLLRSQLDAYDSRLPGTGMFDLKTRAVVSIRMNVRDHESGMGYEIQNRFGDIESYEKEYFDMIRSAFLKYSLQVRMGRMDGIFVAYHNIERIFGFQYISLPEMDLHLHGTENPMIGDTEFKLSVALVNEIFNRATSKMPETSIRFHFETRDSASAEGSYMYIFAEAQTEEDIENIQNSRKAEIAEFEARIFNNSEDQGEDSAAEVNTNSQPIADESSIDEVAAGTELYDSEDLTQNAPATSEKFPQPPAGKLMGFTLRSRNKVNSQLTLRPDNLDEYDSWDVEYTLEEMPHDRALSVYNQCRGRRAKLQQSTQNEDAAANYYLRTMKRLSDNGRSLRKKIDQYDAGKPVLVLDRVQ